VSLLTEVYCVRYCNISLHFNTCTFTSEVAAIVNGMSYFRWICRV